MLHRLEAGGLAIRLKARLFVVSAGSVPLPDQVSLRVSWLLTTSTLKARGSKVDRLFDCPPDVLEVVAWKARDFRSQEWTLIFVYPAPEGKWWGRQATGSGAVPADTFRISIKVGPP